MKEDEEGFIIPNIDNKKCKECGKCSQKCPAIHPISYKYPIDTKLSISKDSLLGDSASGGFFVTIARYFIEELHGIVYGVVLDSNFICKHVEASTMDEVRPMQNSKYIQSEIGDTYLKVKQRLDEQYNVLFTGTPCQVAALKSYLGKEYDKLLCIDVVCHGVPNQAFWRKYILETTKDGPVLSYRFRNRANKRTQVPSSKERPRGTQEITCVTSNGVKIIPARQDPFYGSFVRNESFRQSCYYCQYAQPKRVSDFTMGDCDSEKNYLEFYPAETKSIVLINSDKGVAYWKKISDKLVFTQLDYALEIKANTCLGKPSDRPSERKYLYNDLHSMSWSEFCKKYVPQNIFLSRLRKIL